MSSDYAQSGRDRRDYRHIHDEPERFGVRGRKKNTKKWCRGKVGLEHDFHPVNLAEKWGNWVTTQTTFALNIKKCARCGKEQWGHAIIQLLKRPNANH